MGNLEHNGNALYQLKWATYDEETTFIIWGPKVGDWQGLCDSLVEEAGLRAVALNEAQGKGFRYWVGWLEVVRAISQLLAERGYRILSPPDADYVGSTIIDHKEDFGEKGHFLGQAGECILAFNQELKRELDRELERKLKEAR